MKPDLCNGCKHFLQHGIGLGSACNARLNVEALGTGTRNTSVRDKHVGDEGHTIVIQCEIRYHDSLLTRENQWDEHVCALQKPPQCAGEKKYNFADKSKTLLFISHLFYFLITFRLRLKPALIIS